MGLICLALSHMFFFKVWAHFLLSSFLDFLNFNLCTFLSQFYRGHNTVFIVFFALSLFSVAV